jgi:hypothetical protein
MICPEVESPLVANQANVVVEDYLFMLRPRTPANAKTAGFDSLPSEKH